MGIWQGINFWKSYMGFNPVGLSLRKVMYKSQRVGMCVSASVLKSPVDDSIPINFQ